MSSDRDCRKVGHDWQFFAVVGWAVHDKCACGAQRVDTYDRDPMADGATLVSRRFTYPAGSVQ